MKLSSSQHLTEEKVQNQLPGKPLQQGCVLFAVVVFLPTSDLATTY